MKGPPIHWTTLKKLCYLKAAGVIGSSPSWAWQFVTGTAPLALLDAVAKPLKSLMQYGLCVQDGTPTPDSPVDIVTNNGALRYGALGRNLLDPSAANTLLGYYINKADGEQKAAASNFMFKGYMPVEAGKTYVAYGRRKTDNDLSDYNRIAWYDSTKTWIAGADYTQNRIAVVTAPENAAYARFSCNPSGTTTQTVTQEIVDSYNWMFAEGAAEITPFVPFVGGIYPSGTPETLWVSPNYGQTFTLSNDIPNYSGDDPHRAGTILSNLPAGKYTLKYGNISGRALYVYYYDGGVKSSGYQSIGNGVEVTLSSGGSFYLYGGYGVTAEQISTLTLEVYNTTEQTVNDVRMLLGLDDTYRDAEELIGGIKTGKVGVKVLDGTEEWTASTSYPGSCYTNDLGASPIGVAMCSHFTAVGALSSYSRGCCFKESVSFSLWYGDTKATAIADLTAFLATQYAAGTPVIVIYPLATETTEQGTAHSLHTSAGDNVVDVTSNVDPVTVAAEYAKESA